MTPPRSKVASLVLARLAELQRADLPVHGGRTLAYVYDGGVERAEEVGRAAMAAYAGSNALDPTAFPSLLRMENELVGRAADLLDAPDDAVGNLTSGGTESILLAVQGARDSRPEVRRPRMVLPSTAHAAFHKAAHYFGVEPVSVPVDPATLRAAPDAMAAALDERTVLVVASAPSYAHGVVDPVEPIAAAAAECGIRCHVDACIGGWILPYAVRLGRSVPPWTFAVPGVTSISVDLHKYAYTPKGASLLLHRNGVLREPQLYASAAWPGYTMLNSTMQSTKSGGPVAAAWAVTKAFGDDGYLEATREALAAVDRVVAEVDGIPQLRVVVPPDSTLVALATDDSCDVFTLADEMGERGWYVQPQMGFAEVPATLHLSVSAGTSAHLDEFAAVLRSSVAAAVSAGPVVVPEGLADAVGRLDPSELDEATFEGLLATAGLDLAAGLPARMAPVNALLDLAAPDLREAVLKAFLAQLSRPVRG
ncbi:pyridoxal phosphate-dependent decarboxylase family protein [Segeticoccus rhizosphaerae]|jgi:glutamate/tyrosine decarboxylase-like PLP-dependent enzyme|uniref:pyridoxal phosphate-dependent decarboxylase family protein n=1 Tax=Segeticoccus rhizosphaerae TaxID=1104777 RepID=UPI0010C0417C|nr:MULTISPECIES: aminotransferase class V-fold PLP-dependent enzyme [Intrasporangiaceae]